MKVKYVLALAISLIGANVAHASCVTIVQNGINVTQCSSQQQNNSGGSSYQGSFNFASIDSLLQQSQVSQSQPSYSYNFSSFNMSNMYSWMR